MSIGSEVNKVRMEDLRLAYGSQKVSRTCPTHTTYIDRVTLTAGRGGTKIHYKGAPDQFIVVIPMV